MSTKRQQDSWKRLRELQDAGWNATKTNEIRFNSGSETPKHAAVKMMTGKVLVDRGLKVSSEVEHPERGELDILCHGPPDGKAYGVECETGLTSEVKSDKISRYVHGPIRDCMFLEVEDAPDDVHEMVDWIHKELFGYE